MEVILNRSLYAFTASGQPKKSPFITVSNGMQKKVWIINITTPTDLSKIRSTLFNINNEINISATEFAINMYRSMQAINRSCELTISISHPLTEEQAKK